MGSTHRSFWVAVTHLPPKVWLYPPVNFGRQPGLPTMFRHLKSVVSKSASYLLRVYRRLAAAVTRKGGPGLAAANTLWVIVPQYLVLALVFFGFWPGNLATQEDYSIRLLRQTIVLDGAYAIKKADERLAACEADAKARLLPAQLLLAAEASLKLEEIREETGQESNATPPKPTNQQKHLARRALFMGNTNAMYLRNQGLLYDTAFEQADRLVVGLCTPAQSWVEYVKAITIRGEPEEAAAASFHIQTEDRLEATWYSDSDLPMYISVILSVIATSLTFFALSVYQGRLNAMLFRHADTTPESHAAK